MIGVLQRCGLGAELCGARALFLVSLLLMNAILPSTVGAAQNTTAPHQMASDQMDHAAMGHAVSAPSQSALMDHDEHGGSLHCMSSVCCYQEASAPFALVASDAFLTNRQITDRGSHLPSFYRSVKDRPPQQI